MLTPDGSDSRQQTIVMNQSRVPTARSAMLRRILPVKSINMSF